MFCYQCEQAAKGVGCEIQGVCGKDETTSNLQDLLIFSLESLSSVVQSAKEVGIEVNETLGHFVCQALFSTLTNVNFDPERLKDWIKSVEQKRDDLKKSVTERSKIEFSDIANFKFANDISELETQGKEFGLKNDPETDPDKRALKHTILFGLKGIAAYADHAAILGEYSKDLYDYMFRALFELTRNDISLEDWVNKTLEVGKYNLLAMELLDRANTKAYGDPVPTSVPLGHKKGKAILVSGHDLKDLEEILKQSQGKGIYVYTHGEMLPTHGYPLLKEKYPHFYGHFGTAWQNQIREFPYFPGPIVMTTNCIQRPQNSYFDNIFTTGVVAWPGVKHITNYDYSLVIQKALEMKGFEEDLDKGSVMVGFGRKTLLSTASKVIDLVKNKKIRHFFLVGGCDGAKPGRSYYSEFVEKVPEDCIVLTLACGKFRFFDKKLGEIDGLPRLIDVGQCNDAYSAIVLADTLAKAFNVGVNDLPLSLILSWYEQKAVAILLSLLYLGIKNIRLGPSLPAFITPNVLDVLVKNFNIAPIRTPDEDLKAILG
ncbi:Hydroxylamine reductase [Thermodesulfobium narugense DSM 14796]|uniref:Hydroxylamine reductase n=1 Tax=Thermodesulfobium narugense DSM 14796 TaxID=747365 RepID=M1E7A4_9BACT|nr:hydroxylamine reductase [Thermodesulfobium narugense]AEE15196.1 Hydroxylamine reductase [Thermodesulfobium narugense DSM 14796]